MALSKHTLTAGVDTNTKGFDLNLPLPLFTDVHNAAKQLTKLGKLIQQDKIAYQKAIIENKDFACVKKIFLRLKEYQQIANILIQDVSS